MPERSEAAPLASQVCRVCGDEIVLRDLKSGPTWCRVGPPAGSPHVICERSQWGWHEPADEQAKARLTPGDGA